ncbi:vascular endothelial growth factor C-like [Stylophora pistillata]|nr:vascular endothelial growth factor C-like [Stylophora pistillata]XP_022798384.1 vascular endothelial growth factor C-like [Stylophora pistillata]
MLLIISIFVLELLDVTVSAQKAKSLPNVFCQPHETIIPVDPTNYGYYPFYVNLHRCSGSANSASPKVQHCVAQRYEEINVEVHSRAANFRTIFTMQNHTSCTHKCVASPLDCDLAVQDWDENECACKCRYLEGPPKELACKKGFSWNQFQCKCVCARPVEFCPVNMEWSNTACGCVCNQTVLELCEWGKKSLNASTCECEGPKTIVTNTVLGKRNVEITNWKHLVLYMVGEFVVLFLLFDLILYYNHGSGIICKACRCLRRATSNNGQEVAYTETSNGFNASGNQSPTIEIKQS